MSYKIFATLLMFGILMICLQQSFTEVPADGTLFLSRIGTQ